jgi:hypothetical protein
MSRDTADFVFWLSFTLLVGWLLVGCERVVYVERPTPTAVASPTPVAPPAQRCASVPRAQGDCYRTEEDAHLAAVEAAHDASSSLVYKGEIQGGAAYLVAVMVHLRDAGLCAGVFENEEVAVWAPGAETSENWDLIAEPGDGRLLPRRGPGAHEWTCRPPTTESGS